MKINKVSIVFCLVNCVSTASVYAEVREVLNVTLNVGGKYYAPINPPARALAMDKSMYNSMTINDQFRCITPVGIYYLSTSEARFVGHTAGPQYGFDHDWHFEAIKPGTATYTLKIVSPTAEVLYSLELNFTVTNTVTN